MRSGRGAWMRFPDVSAKPVSFKERIAGFRSEKESGAIRRADTHPCDECANPAGGRWILSPSKIHVSPCLCVSQLSSASMKSQLLSSAEPAAHLPCR